MLDTLAASQTPQPTRPSRKRNLHALSTRLHTIAGLFIAPFIIIAAITGLLYAVAPTMEQVAYKDLLTTQSEGALHPLSHQVAQAQKKVPDLAVSGVQPAEEAGQTTRVLFTDPDLDEGYRQAVFVDPVNLDVLGQEVQYGSSRALPLRATISQLHRSLALGDAMRWYSELAASWLGALALSGTYMWWKRRKARRKPGRTHWHSKLGIWLMPGLLFLAITGLTWSAVAGNNIAQLRTHLNWLAPKPDTTLSTTADSSAAAPVAGMHAEHMLESSADADLTGIDTVWATAREHLNHQFELSVPSPGEAWLAQELRIPWELTRDSIAIDPNTGDITDTVNFADWPLAAKLTDWLIQLHMGLLFGWVSQLALALLALGIVALAGLGYYNFWQRRKIPARSAGRANWVWLALLVVYAMIAPLFGLSLIVFLLIAAAWGWIDRRRQPRSTAIHSESEAS